MKKYYYINGSAICEAVYLNSDTDKTRQALGNMFESEIKCAEYYTYLKVRQKLIEVANKLNKKNPIDWEDTAQPKYTLLWNYTNREIQQISTHTNIAGSIYCTDDNFINEVLKQVNAIDLGNYLRYNPLKDLQDYDYE